MLGLLFCFLFSFKNIKLVLKYVSSLTLILIYLKMMQFSIFFIKFLELDQEFFLLKLKLSVRMIFLLV